MVEAGLGPYMCAPLHDAVYLECPIEEAKQVEATAAECFRVAGNNIADDGVTLRTEPEVTYYPERYISKGDKKAKANGIETIWDIVEGFIAEKDAEGFDFGEYSCAEADGEEADELEETA